ncbi:RagB/SusD family nutrient uptake outer membrane protein [Bacteroides helcogenes]|nr:RagB/SusD family nutrient uptake outer membrane protein [Bacteroides helcogenes]MDY5240025.1 RagB/SusD family nutrient uptake outer membrane protein [Bacteroides helcogenes]
MKKIFIGLALLAGVGLSSCNDSFLEKTPVTDLTEDNAFNSYDNFKAFVWPCYEMFTNTTIRTSLANYAMNGQYGGDVDAGYLESKSPSGQNAFAYQSVGSTATGNGWNFSGYIRRVNIMLSHIDASSMSDAEKKHWRSVGYFFHSFWYMELIDRFGDVPWVNQVLDETSPEAYGPRMDRKIVADSVLNRLKYAEQNIGDYTKRDGDNTINKNCVLAAISRFGLREGTWRKYHELGDETKFLQECVRTSELLMNEYPSLYMGTDGQPAAGYGEMWTTDDLSKVPGVILYKAYVEDINPHGMGHVEHTSSHATEMNQNTVDMYLMKNGKPIMNDASGYHGNKDMYAAFRDRDPRLYHTVIPPYKVKSGKGDYTTWSYTANAADREYIDIMGPNTACTNPGVGMKRLPGQNWSASLLPEVPRLATGSFISCRSGYYVWKNWTNWETNSNLANLNVSDKPIFKIEEVLLNEAEAKFELGLFNQDVADKTINKLRERADVAEMTVADIDGSFDPNRGKYYPKGNETGIMVDPVLWEIRRERIIELMGEGFGFYDVRRWRMAPWFLNRTAVGLWVTKAKATSAGMTLYNPETGTSDGTSGSLTGGNIFLFNKPAGWLEKYYLYQVPTTERLLNPQLTQNPGWD